MKQVESIALVNLLGFVTSKNAIKVERYPKFVGGRFIRSFGWENKSCRKSLLNSATHISFIRTQKECRVERLNVGIGIFSTKERSSTNFQSVMLAGLEKPAPGVGIIPRKHDYFDGLLFFKRLVQVKQPTNERECNAFLERVIDSFKLMLAISVLTILAKDLVCSTHLEYCTTRYCYD